MEVVIVATRRLELLERCLASFSEKMFCNFDIDRVLVNIDPIWGSEADQSAIKVLLNNYFKNVEIFEPNEPDFSKAVKNLWLNTKCDIVFHLEEDWVAIEDISPNMVFSNLKDDVTSLSLMNSAKNNKKRSPYHYRRYRPWYLPFKIEDKSKPHFGTSPSFWSGEFMRQCAEQMDVKYDPEKQFYGNLHPKLENFVKNKKCMFLFGNPHLVEDIGREWQEKHHIKKYIKDGASYWTS